MNTTSASPAEHLHEAAPVDGRLPSVPIWDVPVRVFHWLMVLCFAGAFLTAESERWRLVHVTLGYTMAGLVAFRLVWGVVGTRHARFASFVRGPTALMTYLRGLAKGRPEHTPGHNPAGALAIIAMLSLAAGVAATGWAIYNDIGAHWLEELHEGIANLMLATVVVHVAGVLLSSWLHKENLVRAMWTGRKRARTEEASPGGRRIVAVLLLLAVLGFWWSQWGREAPAGALPPAHSAAGSQDDDDD